MTTVSVVSDGTSSGTQVLVDGRPLLGVLEVAFSIRCPDLAQVVITLEAASLPLDLREHVLDLIRIEAAPDPQVVECSECGAVWHIPFMPGVDQEVLNAVAKKTLSEHTVAEHPRVLTSNDPQPTPGTMIRICDGTRWINTGDGWVHEDGVGDPESWNKVAGNYGPVTVIP